MTRCGKTEVLADALLRPVTYSKGVDWLRARRRWLIAYEQYEGLDPRRHHQAETSRSTLRARGGGPAVKNRTSCAQSLVCVLRSKAQRFHSVDIA